jgi:PBSX family phage terminase large subunit
MCLPLLLEKAPRGKGCIIGVSIDTIKRNVIDSLIEVFGSDTVRFHLGEREVHIGGRVLYCVGAVDDRAEAKIRGATFACALVDEWTKIPEQVFRVLVQRMSLPGACMVCTTNTDSPFHWVKTDYLDRAEAINLKEYRLRLEDNPSLPKDYIATLKASHTGVSYLRFIEGQWARAEGLVFPMFGPNCIYTGELHCREKYIIGCDYGVNNPCAFIKVSIDHNQFPRILVEKEYYFNSSKEGFYKTELEYTNDLIAFADMYKLEDIYADPSALSFINSVKKESRLPIQGAKNEVLEGIMSLGTLLATGDLKIHESCTNLIGELYTYAWDQKKTAAGKDVPRKEYDHAIDALRYAVHSANLSAPQKADSKRNRWEREYSTERTIYEEKPYVDFGKFKEADNLY